MCGIRIDLDMWISKVEETTRNFTELKDENHRIILENQLLKDQLAELLADKYKVKNVERGYRVSAFNANNSCVSQNLSECNRYKLNDKSFTISWNKFKKDFKIK